MMKLTNNPSHIHVNQMQDGQIAIIREWNDMPGYYGRIVQRYGAHLISLGEPQGKSWLSLFEANSFGKPRLDNDKNFLVELLSRGAMLEV